jgi:hypothetical protein
MFACDCSEAALTKASKIVSSLSAESRTIFFLSGSFVLLARQQVFNQMI